MITPRAVLEALATLVQREISCDRGPLVGGGIAASVVPGGPSVPVISRVTRPAGERGLAMIQVQTSDAATNVRAPAAVPRQRVLLDVRWDKGGAGGEATVDATRGALFTLTGVDAVEVDARIVASGPGAIAFGNTKRIEGVVSFGGAISPRPAYVTSETLALVAGVASARIAIPPKASSMIALSDTPASLGTVTASWFQDFGGGGAAIFATINPNANGTGVWHGAEFVGFTSAVANMNLTPVWELSL